WSSAGELASRLRTLSDRRATEARRLAELAAQERAKHHRRLFRIGAVATGLVVLFTGLAFLAWMQSHKAKRANAADAIKQAAGLRQTDFTAGRKARGMLLLEKGVRNVSDRAAVRTASAAVFGLPDLVRISPAKTKPQAAPASSVTPASNETCRAVSHN